MAHPERPDEELAALRAEVAALRDEVARLTAELARRPPPRRNADRDAAIRRLRGQDAKRWTHRALAERFGMNPPAVRQVLSRGRIKV
jgi:hypothetical protein